MKRLRLRQNFPSDSNRAVVIILFNSNIPERLIKNNCPSRCYCVVLRNIQFSTNRAAVTSFWQRRKDQSTMFATTFSWHDVTAHTFPSYRYKSPNFFPGSITCTQHEVNKVEWLNWRYPTQINVWIEFLHYREFRLKLVRFWSMTVEITRDHVDVVTSNYARWGTFFLWHFYIKI